MVTRGQFADEKKLLTVGRCDQNAMVFHLTFQLESYVTEYPCSTGTSFQSAMFLQSKALSNLSGN